MSTLTSTVISAALVPSMLAIISEFILAHLLAATSTIDALLVVTAPATVEGVILDTLIRFITVSYTHLTLPTNREV